MIELHSKLNIKGLEFQLNGEFIDIKFRPGILEYPQDYGISIGSTKGTYYISQHEQYTFFHNEGQLIAYLEAIVEIEKERIFNDLKAFMSSYCSYFNYTDDTACDDTLFSVICKLEHKDNNWFTKLFGKNKNIIVLVVYSILDGGKWIVSVYDGDKSKIICASHYLKLFDLELKLCLKRLYNFELKEN